MPAFNIASVLGLLPVVGPVIAALPEFKKIYDDLTAAFDSDADQDTLKAAYAMAVKGSTEANDELAALVAQHGG